jgi:hypothetical protein
MAAAAAATRKDLLKKVYNMVPPMLESFHKGETKHDQSSNETLTSYKVNWVV